MKINKKGCKPSQDVCLYHCEPLLCRHGCGQAIKHQCKDEIPYGEKETRPWKLNKPLTPKYMQKII